MLIGTRKFPRSRQTNSYTCGSRCVYAILKFYDFKKNHKWLVNELGTNENGTTVSAIVDALRKRTLQVVVSTKTSLRKITGHLRAGGVAIIHVDSDHFIVLHARSRKKWYIMDPFGKPDIIHSSTLNKRWQDRWAILVRD